MTYTQEEIEEMRKFFKIKQNPAQQKAAANVKLEDYIVLPAKRSNGICQDCGTQNDIEPDNTCSSCLSTVPEFVKPEILVSKGRKNFGLTWDQANANLQKEGAFMLTLTDFIDLMSHLKSGSAIYDGTGKQLTQEEVSDVYKNVFSPLAANRAGEYLDAKFRKEESRAGKPIMTITHNKFNSNGDKYPSHEILTGYMERSAKIDFEFVTKQGLPREDIIDLLKARPNPPQQRDLIGYSPPEDKCVAAYDAGKQWLFCNVDPSSDNNYEIEVRPARLKL